MENDTEKSVPTLAREKKKRPATAGEKLAFLWRDKRNWKGRLLNALPVSFALAYTFFLFQPLEVYLKNSGFLVFKIGDLTPSLIWLSIAVFVGLGALLTLVRGKIHNALVSLSVGILVCGYLQTNLLNIDHGTLDGAEVVWRDYSARAVLNLLLWVVICLLPFLVHYLFPKVWKYSIRTIAGLLVLVQTVALVYLIFTTDSPVKEGYLVREGIYDVSDDNNVIVFLLDRFDKRYADRQIAEDPTVEQRLAGFTYYENFVGSYSRTYPSVNYFLTGVPTDYSVKPWEYMETAWTTSSFLSDLDAAGCDVRVYTELSYTIGNAKWAADTVDNAYAHTTSPDRGRILSAMMMLSAYRWTPEALKPYYHFYTDDISYNYVYPANDDENSPDVYSTDDVRFCQDLKRQGLTVTDDEKVFRFYHMQGSHDPFYMDENGNRTTFSSEAEGQFRQTKGDLNTIFRYIELLKEKGIFDQTTIIITADHGRTGTVAELSDSTKIADIDGEPQSCERVPALFVKPAGAGATDPMQRSRKPLCVDNVRFTILKALGIDYADYDHPGYEGDAALAIEDVEEDAELVRYFHMNGAKYSSPIALRDWNLITYRVTGDANDFSNWEKIKTERIKYPYYDSSR